MNENSEGRGMAITSLVLGILGLLVFGIILGPLAMIFGAISGSKGLAMGWWGFWLGVVDTIGALIFIIYVMQNTSTFY